MVNTVDFVGNDGTIRQKAAYILMERGEVDLCSLVDRLSNKKLLTPAKIRFLWEGMLEALKYMRH